MLNSPAPYPFSCFAVLSTYRPNSLCKPNIAQPEASYRLAVIQRRKVVTNERLVIWRTLSLSQLQQTLTSTQVGASVSLGLLREGAGSGPKINQRLHGLQLVRLEHVDLGGGEDEVAEAAVECLLQTQVVEGLDEVRPVEVRVNAEHLAEDGLADVGELDWETTALSNPVAGASKLGERSVERCWTSWDWSVGSWGVESARCESSSSWLGRGGGLGE